MNGGDRDKWRRRTKKVQAEVPTTSGASSSSTGDSAFKPADRVPESGFTLEKALGMQVDLYKGFCTTEFQIKLSELQRTYPRGGAKFVVARSSLFLDVQIPIMSKYGFEGSQEGVVEMLAQAARYNDHVEFRNNRGVLNRLLGLPDPDLVLPPLKTAEKYRSDAPVDMQPIVFRNPRGDVASAHSHLLGPNSLTSKYSTPGGKRLLIPGSSGDVSKAFASSGKSKNDAEFLQRIEAQMTAPEPDVEVIVRQAMGDVEIKVAVPGNATFNTVKEAICMHVGRADCLEKGHLVRSVDGTYKPFNVASLIGEVREVLVIGISLEVFDDDEARTWRAELEARIGERREQREKKLEQLVAPAAEEHVDEQLESVPEPPAVEPEVVLRKAPHGECWVVGSWDDYSGKHMMAWDGSAYRIGMNLDGTEEVSFQILAEVNASIIHPSVDSAGPEVPHKVLVQECITKRSKSMKNELRWKIHVEASKGSEQDNTYEIALHCPAGETMHLQWDKISLDSMEWFSTEQTEQQE